MHKNFSTKIAELFENTQLFSEYLATLTRRDGIAFDFAKILPDTHLTFSDCITRIKIISELSEGTDKLDRYIMVPQERLDNYEISIDQCAKAILRLTDNIKSIIETGNGASKFDQDIYQITTKNGQAHDVRSYFAQFAASTDKLLDAHYRIIHILKPNKSTFSFLKAANSLSSHLENYKEAMNELETKRKELLLEIEFAQSLKSELEGIRDETGRLKTESANDRKSISEYLAQSNESRATIESTATTAETLNSKLTEFQTKFDSFDRQMDSRLKNIEEGKAQQKDLFNEFDLKNEAVQALISKSEKMLNGATVAGLATSFSDAYHELGNQLMWARISFYIGILFLFVSAIPLMVYVFLPVASPFVSIYFPELTNIEQFFTNQTEITGWQYLGQVLARFIILLPAAWLVSFSAIRHSSLFRLREHYAYKYSMAVAVEGFRNQAEGYESEIAAVVLEQLAFNPADKLIPSNKIEEGKIPKPMLELLLNKLRKKLE